MEEEKSPQTVSSMDTLGSTPLDPEKADHPATKRELLRLREAIKETRTALMEEACQRESLESKLAGRIFTLSSIIGRALEEDPVIKMVEELRQEFEKACNK